MISETRIAWVDIETTGAREDQDSILELAILITDHDDPTTYIDHRSWVFHCTSLQYEQADEYVREMHTKNGLWEECFKSDQGLNSFEAEACEFLAGPNKYTIAGASIGNFDLAFIKREFPLLASRFSHRVLDVTGVKMLCMHLGGDWDKLFPRGEAHRALDDISESIQHYSNALEYLRNRK